MKKTIIILIDSYTGINMDISAGNIITFTSDDIDIGINTLNVSTSTYIHNDAATTTGFFEDE